MDTQESCPAPGRGQRGSRGQTDYDHHAARFGSVRARSAPPLKPPRWTPSYERVESRSSVPELGAENSPPPVTKK